MSKFSLAEQPVLFVSNARNSKAITRAVGRGELRKLASRLYSRDLKEDPARLVRRNWYYLVTSYYPDALIADRTALENKPADDGSVFLISDKKRDIELPGVTFRPRKGPGPMESDKPFVGGARLSSTARAYLENMRPSRARDGHIARTLTRKELETRLNALIRQQGKTAINRIRDDARAIAPQLGLEKEAEAFSTLVGTLLGTYDAKMESDEGRARAAGQPFDPDRIRLFGDLFAALREIVPNDRPASQRDGNANVTLAFFEAYFSNFIEGTEFSVQEAADIVFNGVIPTERPEDAHDIIGTFRLVSDLGEMQRTPRSKDEFIDILRRRHAIVMEGRPDKQPGTFKSKGNQAGTTVFVAPGLVSGTLEKGFEFLQSLAEPFHKAVFMMTLVSEAHPFVDGNGRVGRIMMNAELIAAGQERIIIPTAYRTDYLGALKAFSDNAQTTPLLRMLDYAQRYTHAINWSTFDGALQMLQESNAFKEDDGAKLKVDWQAWDNSARS
jgi:fido (protein-threonine AMPylation protein)